jgi:biotin carboxyl carrier protein
MSEPFQITVNGGQHQFPISPEAAEELDVAHNEDGTFHILYKGRSYHAIPESADYKTRTFTFRINGDLYSVKIADYYDRLVQKMGLSIGSTRQLNQLKAPMPGLVLNVIVAPGQEVQKGDALLILEAMKMENVIKAAGAGRVKSIEVQKGTAVEKGQLLLTFE